MAMAVERGSEVEAGGVVILHSGDSGLEDMAGLPELGALVHVLIEPLVADGKVELLDEESQLGVEGSKERESSLEELD